MSNLTFFCPNCWNEVGADDVSCPHCGQDQRQEGVSYLDKLLAALRHPERTRAGLAIEILANRLHETTAVEPLIQILRAEQDFGLRAQAASGLGNLGDQRAVEPLADVLEDGKSALPVRIMAAEALAKLGGRRAKEALKRGWASQQPSVARASMEGLRELGHHGGHPAHSTEASSREDVG